MVFPNPFRSDHGNRLGTQVAVPVHPSPVSSLWKVAAPQWPKRLDTRDVDPGCVVGTSWQYEIQPLTSKRTRAKPIPNSWLSIKYLCRNILWPHIAPVAFSFCLDTRILGIQLSSLWAYPKPPYETNDAQPLQTFIMCCGCRNSIKSSHPPNPSIYGVSRV